MDLHCTNFWNLNREIEATWSCYLNGVRVCRVTSVIFDSVDSQAPLSMGLSKQEYWSGLPCPPPGDLPNPGIEPVSLHVSCTGRCFATSTTLIALSIYSSCWGLRGLGPMETAAIIRLQRWEWRRGSLLPWGLGLASGRPWGGIRSSVGHSPQPDPGPLAHLPGPGLRA